jgi:hypothetical protein
VEGRGEEGRSEEWTKQLAKENLETAGEFQIDRSFWKNKRAVAIKPATTLIVYCSE